MINHLEDSDNQPLKVYHEYQMNVYNAAGIEHFSQMFKVSLPNTEQIFIQSMWNDRPE